MWFHLALTCLSVCACVCLFFSVRHTLVDQGNPATANHWHNPNSIISRYRDTALLITTPKHSRICRFPGHCHGIPSLTRLPTELRVSVCHLISDEGSDYRRSLADRRHQASDSYWRSFLSGSWSSACRGDGSVDRISVSANQLNQGSKRSIDRSIKSTNRSINQ